MVRIYIDVVECWRVLGSHDDCGALRLARIITCYESLTAPIISKCIGVTCRYYFNSTLQLGVADSHVAYAAYRGERVVLSGGLRLSPQWKPFKAGILQAEIAMAPVLLSKAERAHWATKRAAPPATRSSAAAVGPAAAPSPPPPAGWQAFPAHCMSEKPCAAAQCNCASRSFILDYSTGGVADARASCAKDRRCTSFAVLKDAAAGKYETYAGLRNNSAVKNAQWDAFSMLCSGADCKPPAPSPPAPPPSPPAPAPAPHEWGAPPARVNTLFVDGVRQVHSFPTAVSAAKRRMPHSSTRIGHLNGTDGGGLAPRC